MEPQETLELKIDGIKPGDVDAMDLYELIPHFIDLLYPGKKSKDRRPPVGFNIKEGSFIVEGITERAAVLTTQNFLDAVQTEKDPGVLSEKRYKSLVHIQNLSREYGLPVSLSTSIYGSDKRLKITPQTNYQTADDVYLQTDLYVYGKITSMGGKSKPTLHLDTEEYGVLTIELSETQLMKAPGIYKLTGIHIEALQSIAYGKIKDAKFIEFLEYDTEYDPEYINQCIEKSAPDWEDVEDSVEWVRSLRGSNSVVED